MHARQPHAKLYIAEGALPAADAIALFHRWIQDKRGDELLIDVHNYSHVAGGPGVILVAHESYHCLDTAEERPGLWYRTRRGPPQSAAAGLRAAARKAALACQWIEADSGGAVRFSGARLRLGFDDRLAAPNSHDTHAQLAPLLATLGSELLGDAGEVTLRQAADPRAGYAVELSATSERPLSALVARL